MAYTELEKRLGIMIRDKLRTAAQQVRFDGKGEPGAMDHVAVARDVLEELRQLGWRDPETPQIGAYHAALYRCGERYAEMQAHGDRTVDVALFSFTTEFRKGCREGLPIPKLCRWLGYIQGLLIERGYTTVEAERDWTRPLFRPLDFPQG